MLRKFRRSQAGAMIVPTFFVYLFMFFLVTERSFCYKIGSPVPLFLRTPTGTVDALRRQMPLFGVPTTTDIDVASLSTKNSGDGKRSNLAFSMTFGGGASASFGERAVSAPWVDLFESDGALQKLTVTFVYCRDGDLHSVSSRAKYVDLKKADDDVLSHFRVDYVWVEEADVDLAGGQTVMMGTIVLVTLMILVRSCGNMSTFDEDDHEESDDVSHRYSHDYSYGGYTGAVAWKGE